MPIAELLAALSENPERFAVVPKAVAFARDVLGLSEDRVREWRCGAAWGRAAGFAIAQRLNDGRASEVEELIEPVDWVPLRRALEQSRGLVLVGAHIGPRLAACHALRKAGFDVHRMGVARPRADDGGREIFVGDPISRARSLVVAQRILSGGGIVYVAGDGRHRGRVVLASFFGREIEMARGVPHLARLTGPPSIPIAALWKNEELRLEIRFGDFLPVGTGDTGDRFWAQEYLRWLEENLRGNPRNHRLHGGLWRAGEGGVL